MRAIAERVGKAEAKDTIHAAEEPAISAAEKAYKETLALNKSSHEAEAAAKHAAKQAVDRVVDARMKELEAEGHGPQRHGPDVTDEQLKARVNFGHDPMTGSTDDGVNVNEDGSPKKHKVGKVATRINTAADYVRGEDYIRNSDTYKTAKAKAEELGERRIELEVPLEEVYGKGYESKLTGFSRTGPRNTVSDAPVSFEGGTLKAFYERNKVTGSWDLVTMYPNSR